MKNSRHLAHHPTARLPVFLLLTICLLVSAHAAGDVKPYDLDDPSEPWRTSQSGVSTRVMTPYTPLKRTGNAVSCWGRSHTFDGPFPTAVSSQGRELLSRPIELRVRIDGRWTSIRTEGVDFTSERPDRIYFESSGREGALEVSAGSWIEYDGLIRTDLTLSSGGQAVTIEGLQLVFAFEPEASILYHTEKRWSGHVYRRSPTDSGAVANHPWQPLVWVGNHDVGFTIVTETWDGWTSADSGAISLEREAGSFTLTLNIITRPTPLIGSLSYRFGLMATPAKPMREDRFGIQIGSMPGVNLTTSAHGKQVHKHFSFPQPADFDATARMLANHRKRGVRHLYYITTSATGAQSEVNKRNHEDWVMAKAILEGAEWTFGQPLIGVDACCPTTTFADFMAWAVEQVMTTFPDNYGIYIDNPGPYFCENTRHGCGAGGKKTYPYFALHDLHKRIYTIVRTHKPDGLVWEHTSQTFNPLQLAWIDVYSHGEQWRDAKVYPREKLLSMFDRPYMEIIGSGRQVGAVPAFLSSMGTWRGDWAHWLLSRTLPWGQMMTVYHGWIDGTPGIAVAEARSRFGLGKEEVDFYLPHELPSWFPVSGKDVIACLWQRRKDGALLAVLTNWGNEPVVAKMNGRAVQGHLGPFVARDALTGIVIGRPKEFLMASVPADSFRLIRIDRE